MSTNLQTAINAFASPKNAPVPKYNYSLNGNGGANFYKDGKPITWQQYDQEYGGGSGQKLLQTLKSNASSGTKSNTAAPQGGPTDTASNTTNSGTGNGSGSSSGSSSSDAYYAKLAQQQAEEDAIKSDFKGKGNTLINQLRTVYDQIMDAIKKTGADTTGRLNKEYDTKVGQQQTDVNNGLYQVDSVDSANNLGDSSYRSTDKQAVQTQGDNNINELNYQRANDIGSIGQSVAANTAKYGAAKGSLDVTSDLLNKSNYLPDISSTVNALNQSFAGASADTANYQPNGAFTQQANSLGNYDTTALESALKSVVGNNSANGTTKTSTVNNLINGSGAPDDVKKNLSSKYIQMIG